MKEVSIWQLAEDEDAYGTDSGRFILTSPDGEEEESALVFDTEAEAEAFASAQGWTIVPLLP